MHVAVVLMGGIVQLAKFVLFGWLWGNSSAGMAFAAKMFIPLWLVVAAVNMSVGLTHAGYSVKAELPIFLLICLVPAAVAALTAWQLNRPLSPNAGSK